MVETDMRGGPPDPHPDSPPDNRDDAPEQVPAADDDGRDSVESLPDE